MTKFRVDDSYIGAVRWMDRKKQQVPPRDDKRGG
jgi:hypothetical protein